MCVTVSVKDRNLKYTVKTSRELDVPEEGAALRLRGYEYFR